MELSGEENAKVLVISAKIEEDIAQMDEEEKCRRAHFVVYNDGTLPLDGQLTSVINQLKKK